jgi:hypothetical protein
VLADSRIAGGRTCMYRIMSEIRVSCHVQVPGALLIGSKVVLVMQKNAVLRQCFSKSMGAGRQSIAASGHGLHRTRVFGLANRCL